MIRFSPKLESLDCRIGEMPLGDDGTVGSRVPG
jgi:hypothetical protein